jgi:hypothetical protein
MKDDASRCKVKCGSDPRYDWRIARFSQSVQILQNTDQTRFHGDNMGSNPVGDAIYLAT